MAPLAFSLVGVIVLLAGPCYGLASRNYTETLAVDYGGIWGDWSNPEFCGEGEFAIGYNLKVEDQQLLADDTSLNGIELVCSDIEGELFGEKVSSGISIWGTWGNHVTCSERPGHVAFLTDFKLQVEAEQGANDDTAANWIQFQCRDVFNQTLVKTLNKDPGHGLFGDWGEWSPKCKKGSAICGLSTKIEADQGDSGDDTALNDVIMYCCDVPEAEHTADPDLTVGK